MGVSVSESVVTCNDGPSMPAFLAGGKRQFERPYLHNHAFACMPPVNAFSALENMRVKGTEIKRITLL